MPLAPVLVTARGGSPARPKITVVGVLKDLFILVILALGLGLRVEDNTSAAQAEWWQALQLLRPGVTLIVAIAWLSRVTPWSRKIITGALFIIGALVTVALVPPIKSAIIEIGVLAALLVMVWWQLRETRWLWPSTTACIAATALAITRIKPEWAEATVGWLREHDMIAVIIATAISSLIWWPLLGPLDVVLKWGNWLVWIVDRVLGVARWTLAISSITIAITCAMLLLKTPDVRKGWINYFTNRLPAQIIDEVKGQFQ